MPETRTREPQLAPCDRQQSSKILSGKHLLRCHDLGVEPQGPGDDDSLRGLGRKAFFWGQRERLLSRIRHTTRLVPFSANARGKLRAFLKADGRPLSWAGQ